MYKFDILPSAPVASWILDDASPFFDSSGMGNSATASSTTTSVSLVNGAQYSRVFKSSAIGSFECNLFKRGSEYRTFALEAWVLPIPKTTASRQQILSHSGTYDGLSILGTTLRFGTQYASGAAWCEYDLGEYRAAHVVGIHTETANELWVDGVRVSHVDIGDGQYGEEYDIASDSPLLCGGTTSDQELAVNGVAFYLSLSGEQILNHYESGIATIGQERIYPQFGGEAISMEAVASAVYIDETWSNFDDFALGVVDNVTLSNESIIPNIVDDYSVAGSWTVGVPLDSYGDTDIYGVSVSYVGVGDFLVETSVDGISWDIVMSGELADNIPSDPTGVDLWVRVSFHGDWLFDESSFESLRIMAFRSSELVNTTSRDVTLSLPAIPRYDYEPNLFRDDNGAVLNGGELIIGVDESEDAGSTRTLEAWMKPTGALSISVSGTKYRNGVADSTLPLGEWSLIHYVSASNITSDIVISGDGVVGQVVLYESALSAGDVDYIWDSYCGTTSLKVVDSGFGISEPASPTKIYEYDWSISAGG